MDDRGQGVADRARVDHARIALAGAAHLVNDLSGNFLSSLTPYLVLRGSISATVAGFVVFVYLIGSSVLQPIFGILSDRQGRKIFAVAGPLWLSVSAGLLGYVTSSWELLALAWIGGIGTAAFHPQAAAMVDSLSPRAKARSMSIFTMGGNIGFAFGPIVAAGVAMAGLHWSALLVFPGAIMAVLMGRYAPRPRRRDVPLDFGAVAASLRARSLALTLIVTIIALRSAVQISLIVFLPLYFHARGYAPEIGSYLAFLLSLSGAAGGFFGGHIADQYGRRAITSISLLLAAPAIALTLVAGPLFIWPLIAVAGALLLASNSVMVVAAQSLLPGNTGLASGLTLGLGFGLSGFVTAMISTFADATSVSTAVFVVPVIAAVAACLGAMLPPESADAKVTATPVHTARAASGE